MRLLLDTHTFLWWDSAPSQLSPTVQTVCLDPANELIVSVVSIWEIEIKRQLGKLQLAKPLADLVNEQIETNRIQILPVLLPHVLTLQTLPSVHKDPFDRLLIAQAKADNLTLLSRDTNFTAYPVSVLW